MTVLVRTLLGVLLLGTAGCGGSGGGGSLSVSLSSDPAVDGFATAGGGFSVAFVFVGDEAADVGIRGFYRFSLAALPAGASITSATLMLNQFDVSAGAPYATLGSLVVESVDIGLGLDPLLDADDYFTAAFSTVPGSLSASAALGPKSIDVTAAVQADRAAGRLTSDFRVGFSSQTDGDGLQDAIKLTSASDDGGTGVFPSLVVQFAP